MSSTTFSGPVRSNNGLANPTALVAPTSAKTQMANGFAAEMVKNTHYLAPANGAALTATLPAASASTAGDHHRTTIHRDTTRRTTRAAYAPGSTSALTISATPADAAAIAPIARSTPARASLRSRAACTTTASSVT